MHRTLLLALATISAAVLLPAQTDPLSTELRQSWARTRSNLLAAAEKMPEENYNFKPAPESQSFRDLIAHTADSAMGTCSAYSGNRKPGGAASLTAKSELVAALKAGLDECDQAYNSISDAKATEMVEGRMGKQSRLGSLYRNTIHLEHEYAQMAVHLRLKGVTPPSSEGRGGQKGGKKKQ